MKKATLCVDVNSDEREVVEVWLVKWREALGFCSENEGCGCCVDIYHIEAPEAAIAELPLSVLATSDWSEDDGWANPQRSYRSYQFQAVLPVNLDIYSLLYHKQNAVLRLNISTAAVKLLERSSQLSAGSASSGDQYDEPFG